MPSFFLIWEGLSATLGCGVGPCKLKLKWKEGGTKMKKGVAFGSVSYSVACLGGAQLRLF